MTYTTTAEVAYGDELFPVGGSIYADVTDKQEAIDKLIGLSEGEKDTAKEWIAYRALIGEGHFVSKPSEPEPSISKVFAEPLPPDDLPYQPHEPTWSQSRILAEREKLIKKEEELLKKQKIEFARQIEKYEQVKTKQQFYNSDGTPYTTKNYVNSIVVLVILVVVLAACVIASR
jgi:hypothetical protein